MAVCELPEGFYQILMFLHENNAYNIPIEESELNGRFNKENSDKIIEFMCKYKRVI